jgi:BirA family transcriptional regulator, biotin operon repressor / biotin---[acetyl-CoA-carboxylase] ligase
VTPREVLKFEHRHVGQQVLVYNAVSSTNDLAVDAAPGTVIVADHQTAGRGQYGRVWSESPGTSLLMSVVLDPPEAFRRAVVLTAWAAVAVAQTMQQFSGKTAVVKWPNDLLVGGKKVCGILIEQRTTTVVGIGLNLNQTVEDFARAGLTTASSIGVLVGTWVDPDRTLAVLLRHLDESYDRMCHGNLLVLEQQWKAHLGLLGRQVCAERTDGVQVFGRLRDLSFDGIELELDRPEAVCTLKPENIRHLSGV